MNRQRVHLLFFFSGIAGLVYQVIWVRQFGIVFGNTIHSAALVTSVFMLGLGLGSTLAGRWADRRYQDSPATLLRAYAVFELGIGLLGLAIAFALPMLEPLSLAVTSYTRGQDGWYALSWSSWAWRYVAAVLVLLPPTLLMGGTLTLLIRYLVRRDLTVVGRRVGVLYGVNTAGAALGALLVDFVLVRNFGLLGSQALAAVANLGVGLLALRWLSQTAPTAEPAPDPSPEERVKTDRTLVLGGTVALALSGFAAMGMEIVWFRFLTGVLGAYRATFSILLGVILVGIWLGATIGGIAHRRLGNAALLYVIAQGVFAASALLMLRMFSFDAVSLGQFYDATSDGWRPLVQVGTILLPVVCLVGIPALLMGFAYPLANGHVQDAKRAVGQRAGLLYLANTAGAVAGSVCAGFVLLPRLGIQTSVLVLCACALGAGVPLGLSVCRRPALAAPRRRLLRLAALVAVAAAAVLLVDWGRLPRNQVNARLFHPSAPGERVLTVSEGVNETIVVTQLADGTRRLNTNGHSMATTTYEAQRYMRAFAHLPLLLTDRPRRALVICYGVGNTLHAASLHKTLENLEVVDLSRHVLRHAGYFRRWTSDVLADPRVAVHVNDGRQHLRMRPPGYYDLITLEPPPIAQAGVASLYTSEFYTLARRRLRRGAFLSQWLPAYQVSGTTVLAMVRSFIQVFPESVLLSGYRAELILLGRKGLPLTVDPDRLHRRLEAAPAVKADLRRVDLGSVTELVGSFAASGETLARITRGVVPVTDDLPIMEYDHGLLSHNVIPKQLFDHRRRAVMKWCPGCDGLPDLEPYLAHMRALYSNRDYLESGTSRVTASPVQIAAGQKERAQVYRRYGYIRRLFAAP